LFFNISSDYTSGLTIKVLIPFLVLFAFLYGLATNQSGIRPEVVLTTLSIFIALVIFIFSTHQSEIYNKSLLNTISKRNCTQLANILTDEVLADDPSSRYSLIRLITEPYFSNADLIYRLSPSTNHADSLMSTIMGLEALNGLLETVHALNVQAADIFSNEHARKTMEERNQDLIEGAAKINKVFCNSQSNITLTWRPTQ